MTPATVPGTHEAFTRYLSDEEPTLPFSLLLCVNFSDKAISNFLVKAKAKYTQQLFCFGSVEATAAPV